MNQSAMGSQVASTQGRQPPAWANKNPGTLSQRPQLPQNAAISSGPHISPDYTGKTGIVPGNVINPPKPAPIIPISQYNPYQMDPMTAHYQQQFNQSPGGGDGAPGGGSSGDGGPGPGDGGGTGSP